MKYKKILITYLLKIINNPKLIIVALIANKYFYWLNDEKFLKVLYYLRTNKRLNLDNPTSFNEKIQWLKINDRQKLYITLADKFKVREYISDKVGEKYLIPLIDNYYNVNEIDFNKLPSSFVLKTTHDSGGVIICNNKTKFNRYKAKKKLSKLLNNNFFYKGREWPYKNIKPRIICEELLKDESDLQLKDYKIFCFNGEPKYIQVDIDRFTNHRRNIYNLDWDYIDFEICYPTDPQYKIPRPECLDEMLLLSKKLSESLKHLRVDLYISSNKIYVGELTLYHGSGFEKFNPEEYGNIFGNLLKINIDKHN